MVLGDRVRGRQGQESGMTKGHEVVEMFIIFTVVRVSKCIHMSEAIKLYFNVFILPLVNHM